MARFSSKTTGSISTYGSKRPNGSDFLSSILKRIEVVGQPPINHFPAPQIRRLPLHHSQTFVRNPYVPSSVTTPSASLSLRVATLTLSTGARMRVASLQPNTDPHERLGKQYGVPHQPTEARQGESRAEKEENWHAPEPDAQREIMRVVHRGSYHRPRTR